MVDLLRPLKLIWQPDLPMLAIGVEPEYRSLTRSLSGWGTKEEPNAPIIAESEVADFLRLLKLIWWSDSSIIAIAAGNEVIDFLKLLKLIWRSDSSMIAITAGSEVTDFLRLLKLIWRSNSSMIATAAGSEVADFYYGWRYHAASFRLAVPCWLGLNKFLLWWWHVAC
jgi:hypothetical protein